ncbi:MAG TPA: hypothetical protein VIC26_08555 [Marinagarivorans sp.]
MATTATNNNAATVSAAASAPSDSKADGSNANDSLTDAYQHMQGAVNSVKEAASTLTASSSAAAKDAYAQGKVKACDASKQTDSWIKERPYTSMGLAFAAGVLVTGLLRK